MSWTLGAQESVENIKAGGLAAIDESPKSDAPEQRAQVDAVKAAIESIVEAGVVGDGEVSITAQGHAVLGGQTAPSSYPSVGFSVNQVPVAQADA